MSANQEVLDRRVETGTSHQCLRDRVDQTSRCREYRAACGVDGFEFAMRPLIVISSRTDHPGSCGATWARSSILGVPSPWATNHLSRSYGPPPPSDGRTLRRSVSELGRC